MLILQLRLDGKSPKKYFTVHNMSEVVGVALLLPASEDNIKSGFEVNGIHFFNSRSVCKKLFQKFGINYYSRGIHKLIDCYEKCLNKMAKNTSS